MTLTSATPITAEVRDAVGDRLATLERERGIRILLAVESGSRAWGFPSTDSDHDIRFLYVHRAERYLSVAPFVETIEPGADAGTLDVGGWELRKALWLLCRSNATPIEWAGSPLSYRANPGFAAALLSLADRIVDRAWLAWHYDRMARRAWTDAETGDTVPLKRYAYALRAALAARWLALSRTLPPMHLVGLLNQAGINGAIEGAAERLVRRKGASMESSTGPREPVLDRLITEVLATEVARPTARTPAAEAVGAADALLVEMIADG